MTSQEPTNYALKQELQEIGQRIWHLAEKYQNQTLELLLILRTIESVHSDIREQMFVSSLPDTRHRLYILLRHLEEEGGWPYIPRMRIKDIFQKLELENQSSAEVEKNL